MAVSKDRGGRLPSETSPIGRFFVKNGKIVLVVIAILTVLFGLAATRVELQTPTIDLFPKDHPYVETYVEYEDIFGGANVIVLTLEVKDGDVFSTDTLEKLRKITKSLELLPAVNNYSVLSLAQRKIKITTVDEIEGFKSDPVMWPDVPQTKDELEELRRKIYAHGQYRGTLISGDDKSLMILAGFFEKGLRSASDTLRDVLIDMARDDEGNYDTEDVQKSIEIMENVASEQVWSLDDTLFEAIQKIARDAEDDNHVVRMIGRPILLGYIAEGFPQLAKIFVLTILAIVISLILYFRSFRGVFIPMTTAFGSAIWGVGFLGILSYLAEVQGIDPIGLGGYHFNPLVIVVPFIISARALSHSVQLIERYDEEYKRYSDRQEAAIATFGGLSKPGILSIVTDAAGVFMVAITPIPLMQKLAVMGGFWIMSIVVTDMILNPVMLSILPPPKDTKHAAGILNKILSAMTRASTERHQKAIIAVTVVIFALGIYFARNLVIGDVHPGTPMLWPSHQYNQDTAAIGERFGKTEILSVVVEGAERDAIKHPKILMTMEKFQRDMEAMPEVSSTSSIADLLPGLVRIMHSSHPFWELIPENLRDSGFYLGMLIQGSEPGDLDRFLDRKIQNANISIYLKDHKGTTLRAVIAEARKFIEENPIDDPDNPGTPLAKMRLAGNLGGLLAAVNETIVASELKVTILAFAFVFVLCALTYKSVWAGIYFLIPITISNYLTYALMGAVGIGLDVNALPVVALGVGLGVDYGLYVVGRIEESYAVHHDLKKATSEAMLTAGRAVFFTAATMVVGIIFWAFSFLRFQAEMGMLLAFWMVISMLGGLILLPTLVVTFKPKFVTHRVDTERAAKA
ncbi:MAG: MMPL family transporter [Deltaproteobacteria bacterium]|nr:MMPL family transporter [Deltaproteobacteria bacterium]MCB9488363.1 MMPL family transporter [Deltaproteobacteria bacterium]